MNEIKMSRHLRDADVYNLTPSSTFLHLNSCIIGYLAVLDVINLVRPRIYVKMQPNEK